MPMCVCVPAFHVFVSTQRPEEGIKSPGGGVAGGCKLSHMGTKKTNPGAILTINPSHLSRIFLHYCINTKVT